MTLHPALTRDRAAVITGAASGIGLAAAVRLAGLGMKVCLADLNAAALDLAAAEVASHAASPAHVRALATDVSRREDVQRLKEIAYETFGEVAFLMNNAGVEGGGALFGARGALAGSPTSTCGASSTACRYSRRGDDRRRIRPPRYRQHRVETGDHLPARRNRLQCDQGRREGRHRSPRARIAQYRGLRDDGASAGARLHVPQRVHQSARPSKAGVLRRGHPSK